MRQEEERRKRALPRQVQGKNASASARGRRPQAGGLLPPGKREVLQDDPPEIPLVLASEPLLTDLCKPVYPVYREVLALLCLCKFAAPPFVVPLTDFYG